MKKHLLIAIGLLVGAILYDEAAKSAPATLPAKSAVSGRELFDDPVVVRGKGFEVKRSHIEDAFTAYAANLAARGETLPELQRPLREAQLLDRLIITRLLVN